MYALASSGVILLVATMMELGDAYTMVEPMRLSSASSCRYTCLCVNRVQVNTRALVLDANSFSPVFLT